WARHLTAKVLDRVQLITLRDSYSRDFLQGLGVRRPVIKVTADSVLGMDMSSFDLQVGQKKLCQLGLEENRKPLAGMSVRFGPFLEGAAEALARMADELVSQGWEVVFLPFHFPRDVEAGYQVQRLMQAPSVLIKERLTLEELVGIISCLDLLVGMRLHALILAAVLKVPFLGLSYDPKVEAFCRQVDQPWVGLNFLDFQEMWSKVKKMIYELPYLKENIGRTVAELRPLARCNAELALRLLWGGVV
ncbi:MAG: polysaccharide pyruvyl transferase family protein, partial [Moorellaceae bacterium]